MNHFFRRSTVGFAVIGFSILVLGVTSYVMGIRVNTTKSIPLGVYRTSVDPVERGAYVFLCPPKVAAIQDAYDRGYIGAGFCPGGYGHLMKRVLAAHGDTVTVRDDGVRVNDTLLPLSVPRRADRAGRPLPRFQADHYKLGPAELLLMSDVSDTSFDSRYFGPVNRSQIKTVIRPVITWKEQAP